MKDLDGVPTFCTLLGIKSSNPLFQIASVDCHSFHLFSYQFVTCSRLTAATLGGGGGFEFLSFFQRKRDLGRCFYHFMHTFGISIPCFFVFVFGAFQIAIVADCHSFILFL